MSLFKFPEVEWQHDPFEHAVIHNAFDQGFLEDCRAEFPLPDDPRWVEHADPEERGKKQGGSDCWGPATKHFFDLARSPEMVSWMESVTGIASLSADDLGGGMHQTGEGGRLAVHVDFNVHPANQDLERRVNMLTFLSPEWDAEWGGVLKLGRGAEIEVLPVFGTTVLFECSSQSYHGHPDPVVGDHLRQSLACYYYAPTRVLPQFAHTTLWM